MTIGGEHFFTPGHFLKNSKAYIESLVRDNQTDYNIAFTFGGYYSILAILDSLKSKMDKNSIILLPSYLCPSILKPFKIRGIKYKFYTVDDDLFVDTNHLISIIDNNTKAVFFIDYFGASQLESLQVVLDLLRSKKITIIQDIVQCLKINNKLFFGDYIFNSFRKFFPFEGSVLLSKEKMDIHFSKKKNRYIKYKRLGQTLRYLHLKFGLFHSNFFLKFLGKAENRYYTNEILKMSEFNQIQIDKFDNNLLVLNQLNHYNKLFSSFGNLVPELLRNNSFVPLLGFIIKVKKRDELRKQLFNHNIFTPVHWVLTEDIDINQFPKSFKLSESILTIPLINLTEKKIQFLFEVLTKTLNNEGLS